MTRAPIETARPPTFPSIVRHSPVWSPARTWIPSSRTAVDDRLRAADPAHRAVERGEEPVARGVELAAAIAREAAAD